MSNLIERYVSDVTRRLPDNQRADVSEELKTTIEDMVATNLENGQSESEAINKVLTELGNPQILADKYTNSPQYLIGPKWFFTYKNLLIKVLKYSAVTIFLVLLGVGIEKGGSASTVLNETLATTANVLMAIAFWITVVFVYIERNDLEIPELKERPWTPDQLPPVPPKRQVGIGESIGGIIGSIFAIGLVMYSLTVPLFNQSVWLPFGIIIILIMIIQLIHQLVMLKVGNWTMPLWITELILNILMIILALLFISIPNLISPSLISNIEAQGIKNAVQIINMSIHSTIVVVILTYIWQIYTSTKLYIELKNRER